MSHTIKHQAKLLARVRRMKGQMEAIETALLAEKPCGDIMNLTASVRGALTGLMSELVEEHIREHIVAEDLGASERHQGADELIDVIRSYLK
ncbi:metal-sensing transcriptional repressor [Agrobacterium vitis]|uniref:Metal-sensing transcriptional repressor n=1 Tax=Agrobacterium vitis TaxID=373 RepID=A0ABD6GDL4_AGRVI|nr:metal/formaldehyde-sensitive transcriptional repressor [Agrobacterium vitis]MCE6074881.1 metal-sensing transcriptional repressor [Agrobacterium vitis]MCM2450955.1 metal/formaldehyde-sensitive transcriptional repressor [Agrobacterium vitis]MCM2467714.1 metal/formaldehyde-sensitive transcriptional repressor [Agrobacterium vitis]MUO68381.1 metal-sensing transcriptional repressor [Agrobacterium vitis]MUO79164.1 metal-sensing transcriptional repressor [Agrobacterium vitis]